MPVAFLDLKAQYESIRAEVQEALRQVFESGAFAGGPFVARFETEFARFCGCSHAVGVGNGTDALWGALVAFGIGPGDEVITAPNTFIATAEAISRCGAKPVFVDIDESTYNMDPTLLERAITPRTRAVIPVHLFGQMADMDPIMEIARRRGLVVVEDASQAHGAEYKGRAAGSIGDAGCFSFYPGKNLGAYGEAGAVVTNNAQVAKRIMMLRDHGQSRKHSHATVGWNARMDGIQGAVLSVKLRHLPAWTQARRRHAWRYGALFAGVEGVIAPSEAPYGRHVYHVYALRVQDRDALTSVLEKAGIGYGIHYPVPVHLQEAYRDLGLSPGSYGVAERCAREYLSLPMFPELGDDQVAEVADVVRGFMRAKAKGG